LVSAVRSFSVGPEDSGERLDKFLVKHCPELGRRGAAWLVARALVKVEGGSAAKGMRLRPGDVVSVLGTWGGAPSPEPHASLCVRLERDDLVVVDKPAGQPTAPLAPDEVGSLAGALLGHYPEMALVGYRSREPGLLHRLDTRTSGLVIAARTPSAFDRLLDALRAHQLDKRYLAIVDASQGDLPPSGVIDRPLMPHPGRSGRVTVAPFGTSSGGVQSCHSSFRVLERRGRWAMLEVVASRAYRHQVRVHLASAGWPIAGDLDYGGAALDALSGRHALHASHVAWAGDGRVPAFAVESPLPPELAAFLDEEGGAPAAGVSMTSSSS
jgi:23S rRNA pseudouridine1911/1915/1917 synthase